jgi:hypothetical protein
VLSFCSICGISSAVSWMRLGLSACSVMEAREALLLQYYGGAWGSSSAVLWRRMGSPSTVSWRRERLAFCSVMEARGALLLQYLGGA